MKLFCVRHGETFHNLANRIQGQTDSELSPLGLLQCQAVAEALAEQSIDVIYSSPLKRALLSAQCIADALHVEVKLEPRLIEINAGVFQGLTWDEIDKQLPADALRWRSQDADYRIPGGESRRDVMLRAKAAFCDIRASGYRGVLVVAHGGSLSAAFKALLEVPPERNPFSLNNGSISRIGWDKDFKLLSLNETGHLRELCSGGGDL